MRPLLAASVSVLMGLTLLAGCFEGKTPAASEVEALLEADKTEAWTGDPVKFSAANSTARAGADILYRFDFGDGKATNSSEPNVTHSYVNGGDFEPTVIVDDQQGNTDVDSLELSINERFAVSGQVIESGLPPAGNLSTSVHRQSFSVGDGAETFDLNLTLRSTLLVGASTIRLRVSNPSNSTLVERNVTVPAGQEVVATLDSPLSENGTYLFEARAFSGGAAFTGAIRVFYVLPEDETVSPPGSAPVKLAG